MDELHLEERIYKVPKILLDSVRIDTEVRDEALEGGRNCIRLNQLRPKNGRDRVETEELRCGKMQNYAFGTK